MSDSNTESQNDNVIFRSLDRDAEIEISERYLPHWFQAGAAVFVTFRAADSIPAEVIARWQQELVEWLRIQELPTELAEFVLARRTDMFYQSFKLLSPL